MIKYGEKVLDFMITITFLVAIIKIIVLIIYSV